MSNINSFRSLSIDTIDEINKLTKQAKSLIQIVLNDGNDLSCGFASSQQVITGTLWAALDLVSQIDRHISNAK
ncbi:hypothetical protein [Pasteurella multocida]|uniref:hypothetical protein n=1 Tax=Pasteurella multocida TaxID=747 RepID=UPI0008FA837F|nr:hypothetical protein [Pasteurella multocida]MDC4235965.1 hypothetical protein [Pasteurella multocida]OIQ13090.1 hypothetical protein UR07_11825 [Pasteurella multocida subsp. multocida]PNW24846.1 hypothetical protein AP056_03435 [Pasteurella multocida subsp. multocida]